MTDAERRRLALYIFEWLEVRNGSEVSEVDERSGNGRNIVGKVDGFDYACDYSIFLVVWASGGTKRIGP